MKNKKFMTNKKEIHSAVKSVTHIMNPTFLINPGKDKVIFKETGKGKHPYFDIEEKYKPLAERNFNLPIPDTDD